MQPVADGSGALSWPSFWRLWIVLSISFVPAKVLFNLAAFGWIDLRPAALLELPVLPLVQASVFWIVTRRRRSGTAG